MSDKTTVKVVVYKDEAHKLADTGDVIDASLIPLSQTPGNILYNEGGALAARFDVRGGFGIDTDMAFNGDADHGVLKVGLNISKDNDNLLFDPDTMTSDTELINESGTLKALFSPDAERSDLTFEGHGSKASPIVMKLKDSALPTINAAHMPSEGVETSGNPIAPSEVGVVKTPHLATVNLLEESEPKKWSAHLYVTREQSVKVAGLGVKTDPLVIALNKAESTPEKPNAIEITDKGVLVDRYKLRDFENKTVQFMVPETPKVITPKMGTKGYEHMREELLVLNGQNTDYTVDLSAIEGEQEYSKHIRLVYYAVMLDGQDKEGVQRRGYSTLKFVTKDGRIITPYGKTVRANEFVLTSKEHVAAVFDIYFGDQKRVMVNCPVQNVADTQVFVKEFTTAFNNVGDSTGVLRVPLDALPLEGLRCAYAIDIDVSCVLTEFNEDTEVSLPDFRIRANNQDVTGFPRVVRLTMANQTATFTHVCAAELVSKGSKGSLVPVEVVTGTPSFKGGTTGKAVIRLKVMVRRINNKVSDINVLNATKDVDITVGS
ncbi:hypothetical protein OWH49_003768 [Escherichia coli]|uniref:hypothetical protein n=1 Tax=Escherichia coli TaxID=562 RepID=UPI001CD960E1|nr:hypothetical protein [Escherichia coli]EKE6829282.1 hypothetical protein [Escherichia coli]MCA2038570.1 hypothetical protein [Escherichia coli]